MDHSVIRFVGTVTTEMMTHGTPHHLPEDAVHRYHRRVGLACTN
jgi:uncharacterized membrane protein YjjP (DUF1212 family)